VGHKVMSSRSSSSVQRDIAASVMEAPSATYRACRFASRLRRLHLFHMEQFGCVVLQMANGLTEFWSNEAPSASAFRRVCGRQRRPIFG
jgi:hypothetical protein